MKNIISTLLLASCFSMTVLAQHCPSTNTSIPSRVGTVAGISPSDTVLPCAVIGSYVSDTLYYHNYDSIHVPGSVTAHPNNPINSLTIDSIDLPPGLCWETNAVNNQFGPGADGVILISGTPTGPPGQYKLRIIANITYSPSGTLVVLLSDKSMETEFGLRYDMRVICPGSGCPAVNIADSTATYIPYTACSTLISAITPDSSVVCTGDSVVLTADSVGVSSYLWSTGATTHTVKVTSGSYTVTVYDGTGDTAVSAPAVVSLSVPDTAITLSGPASICTGDSVTITAAGGLSYLWSTHASSQSITVGSTGIYTVTVTNSTPCSAVSRPIGIAVNQLPVVTLNWARLVSESDLRVVGQDTTWGAACNPDIFPMAGGSPAGGIYAGYDIANDTFHFTQPFITVDTVSYTYTDGNGCSATAMDYFGYTVCEGINNISNANTVSLYPNPNKGSFTLETPGNINSDYTITDMLGHVITQQPVTSHSQQIDMPDAAEGIYILTVIGALPLRFTIMK